MSAGWAITAIALVSVVSENNRLRQEQLDAQTVIAQISQSENRLVSFSGVDGGSATGRLVIDADARSVVLVTHDLPPLPDTEVYRLWAVIDDPVYCGQFNPDRAIAVDQWQLPDSRCDSEAAQLLVTTEKAASELTPTGTLVLEGL
jgi:hypothetical protein